jgi:hypothetical protein
MYAGSSLGTVIRLHPHNNTMTTDSRRNIAQARSDFGQGICPADTLLSVTIIRTTLGSISSKSSTVERQVLFNLFFETLAKLEVINEKK